MRADRFRQFAADARAEGVVFFHSGRLDQDTVISIGAMLRRRLQEEGAGGVLSRRVFNAFMEMAQNIVHYAAEDPELGRLGALSVTWTAAGFLVMCGNYLAWEQVPRVRSRLMAVQEMSPGSVRIAYRQQLARRDEDPDGKGAGPGRLGMAASASAPIEFAFDPEQPTASGYTFLFLKAVI